MTYSVPYSFVPGTKARADEVNANFIDVLDKIENTNSRIEDANEQSSAIKTELSEQIDKLDSTLMSSIEEKADVSLSNLDSTGKSLFSAKADASLLDGTWVSKASTVFSSLSFTLDEKKTYSASSFLPNDSNLYACLLRFYWLSGASQGVCFKIYTSKGAFTTAKASTYGESTPFLLMKGNETITIQSSGGSSSGATLLSVAYRKVR
jgi:hypothetical protein